MFSVHLTLASGILLACFDWVLGTPPAADVARAWPLFLAHLRGSP